MKRIINGLSAFFPFLSWLKEYDVSTLRTDAIAGVTVALVLIPQSMAYAQLAGLPAYYGLYAAFLPPMVASLFGSSRQLATGPVAVVSLMSAASLQSLATAGSAQFIAYSIVLALTVGIFQFLLGVLRLGLVVNFLSHPVVNGFTNAAAIIIATSQLPKFFGVSVDSAEHHYQTMMAVARAAFDYTHLPTLAYGVAAVTVMLVLRKINRRIPNVLVAVVLATMLSYATGFQNDRTIDMAAVRASGFADRIDAFNSGIESVKALGQERAALAARLDATRNGALFGLPKTNQAQASLRGTAKESEGEALERSMALIKLKSEMAIVASRLEYHKRQVAAVRDDLRAVKFHQVTDHGKSLFYAKGEVPAGASTDGTIWRLKVGNDALSENALKLTGGGAVVGTIPQGVPTLVIPELDATTFFKLLPTAVIISLLGFMEAIAIAKAMAGQTGQMLNPNQELIGQGLANIFGSVGSSYAVSGSFSRSAVNFQAGALTGISGVVTSLMVFVTLLFFTPLLYHLPQAVLAAIIMVAVIGLINVKGFIHAWRAQWYDGVISIATFVATLYFAPHLDIGIEIGVGLAMTIFLYKSMRPVVARLSMSEDKVLKNAEHFRLEGVPPYFCSPFRRGAVFRQRQLSRRAGV